MELLYSCVVAVSLETALAAGCPDSLGVTAAAGSSLAAGAGK